MLAAALRVRKSSMKKSVYHRIDQRIEQVPCRPSRSAGSERICTLKRIEASGLFRSRDHRRQRRAAVPDTRADRARISTRAWTRCSVRNLHRLGQ
jgi:hypothetical protein